MEKGYIAPDTALKKLRAARSLKQTVYIYGATGYGKTELVKQYLKNRRYQYISCEEDTAALVELAEDTPEGMPKGRKGTENESRSVVVLDDLHLLKSAEGRRAALALAGRKDVWLIFVCRSPVPSWLMPLYVAGGFIVINENDLCLGEKETTAYMETQDIILTEEELASVCKKCRGNAYAVRHTALKIQEGMRPGSELEKEIEGAFAEYLEDHVLVQWDSDLLEFLMQLSVTEEFTLPLAETITGNSHAVELLGRAAETGNFISLKEDTYRLHPILVKALRRRGAKTLGSEVLKDHAYNAGLWYEMQGQIVPALAMFEKCGNKERIRELLVRNARLNPGNGHYFALRHYYLGMEEKELEDSPVLMAGMSMLYSLLMQEEESEYWYKKLERFATSVKGGQKREAVSRLAYLDIALPHRGSMDMIEIMKKMPALLFDKGMGLPEFSVTSNIPSTMNGGKDFCHWSRNDRKLAATIGKLVERVLGRYGKGLVKAALGESLYEKGEDTYEVLTLLTRAKMEAESGGVPEIAFAAVGLTVRLDALQGELQTAKEVLSSFEKSIREQGAVQLLPNIAALRCRLALREGDKKTVEDWLKEAPDENREFCILERYRYLTKVRCCLSAGEYLKAQSLLEKLRYYGEKCHRTYTRMEINLLSAITKYRTGGEWKEEFFTALKEAENYHFLRIISEEGAAVQELLRAAGKRKLEKETADRNWLSRILEETGKVAVRYPVYLKGQLAKAPDFCEAALCVLRLQAEGKSYGQIAEELSIKEATVKYHAKENYRKLGVSGKTDAVLAARNLGIL
ncbi:MAG: hypothetical protein HDR23_01725 [Lachnospiraceae bacterium]|nr:hypothetical protein [Lachnospiraceae bacterium]MBD5455191.1 hypothetical protein [Lachnospiraceae bacterium]